MLAKQGRPSISSYLGLTGWTTPPSASTFFFTVAHSSLVLLPLVADAPIMATTRGWKNRSSGTSRSDSLTSPPGAEGQDARRHTGTDARTRRRRGPLRGAGDT